MQTLYALSQSEVSNFELGKDYMDEKFAPDLNAPERPDYEKLHKQKEHAKKVYERSFLHQSVIDTESDPEVKVAVLNARNEFKKQVAKDRKYFRVLLGENVNSIYERYIKFLMLPYKIAEEAEFNFNKNKNKFIITPEDALNEIKLKQNKLVEALSLNKHIEAARIKKNISWREGEIASIYRDIVRPDKEYREYLMKPSDFETDKAFILYLLKTLIFKSNIVDGFFEEGDIYWTEDKSIIKSLVVKTLKEIEEDKREDFDLLEISGNWEEDQEFYRELYDKTVADEEELEKLVEDKIKNWDIERLAATDKIILKLAIGEMIHFPSIPVKVTINEYIEISKEYSTPKSKQFVNGVLDKVSEELVKSGVIKKSGRGLIDNK
ncbi:transcription antitermination factor NusB [Sporocytophaga myxococcoides]|nr:transcription antitermination factor NusB [Sporocytophaga myxococcoides]